MADEKNPSLHIDSDWKKQAQEEKRRLAEQEKQKAAAAAPSSAATAGASGAPSAGGSATSAGAASAGARSARAGAQQGQREMPPASFATLVQTIVTQALFYLGDLAPRGGEPMLNLDAAKHQIDLLGVLEEKSVNNLSADEKRLL